MPEHAVPAPTRLRTPLFRARARRPSPGPGRAVAFTGAPAARQASWGAPPDPHPNCRSTTFKPDNCNTRSKWGWDAPCGPPKQTQPVCWFRASVRQVRLWLRFSAWAPPRDGPPEVVQPGWAALRGHGETAKSRQRGDRPRAGWCSVSSRRLCALNFAGNVTASAMGRLDGASPRTGNPPR